MHPEDPWTASNVPSPEEAEPGAKRAAAWRTRTAMVGLTLLAGLVAAGVGLSSLGHDEGAQAAELAAIREELAEIQAGQAAAEQAAEQAAKHAAEQAAAEALAAAQKSAAAEDAAKEQAKHAANQKRAQAERAAWADGKTDFAKGAKTAAPEFPTSVPGMRMVEQLNMETRAFTGGDYSTIYGFGNTMNGCDRQRFLVRWRPLNANMRVEAVHGYMPDDATYPASPPTTGVAGWMSMSACEQPGFRVLSSGDGSTLTDVIVEVQIWRPTA